MPASCHPLTSAILYLLVKCVSRRDTVLLHPASCGFGLSNIFAIVAFGHVYGIHVYELGEHIIPKTVDAPFDYKVKFFIRATSLNDANNLIDTFNASLYSQDNNSDVKTFSQVTFFNDYKRHKIVGYPHPISEATDFWRPHGTSHLNDIVIVEWTIRVTQPSLCEYSTPFTEDTPSQQST